MPGGWIGDVEATTDQNDIGTTEVNLTGLSVSVPVNGGRRVKVTGAVLLNADTGGATPVLRLYRGATGIQQSRARPWTRSTTSASSSAPSRRRRPIRAGIAMPIASLAAEGRSIIDNVRQIDHGCERIDERLRELGASIERIDD